MGIMAQVEARDSHDQHPWRCSTRFSISQLKLSNLNGFRVLGLWLCAQYA